MKRLYHLRKEGIGNDNDFLYILTNLGATYLNLYNNDSCIFYAMEAIDLGKKVKNYPVLLINYQNLIYAKVNAGEFSSLLPLVREIETLRDKIKTPKFEAKLNMNYAIAYYYNGQTRLAEDYALKAYKISEENDLPSITQSTCVILTKIESTLGNYKLANVYDAKRDSIYDAELNAEVASNVQDVEKKYETQKKENEIIKLNATNKQKSILNKILIGSTIGLSLVGFLGYRNLRAKRKLQQAKINELEKDKQLLAIDAMLKGQEEERSRIAKDLHDGLGGMLSGIKLNFVNMKENLIMDAPNVAAFENSIMQLDNTIAELRKVAHNLMPEALVKFGLKNALLDYCNSMQISSRTKIIYEQMGTERELGNTADLYIYRIIQELINNAIKHANANQILIQLTKAANTVLITVEDDGKGLDKMQLANAKGIGMKSIQQRVDYLKGSMEIESTPNQGTSIHIELQA
jgi:two-component system, NarL family, sensor kinase